MSKKDTRPVAERLKETVTIDANGCWLWNMSLSGRDGRGQLMIDGVSIFAHRASYEEFVGPIPEGHVVCHRCDVPHCINPDHLFTGTQKDNVRDMYAKGRGPDKRGFKNPNAKLSENDVREIKDKWASGECVVKAELAREYGVTRQSIGHILHGRQWKDVA